MTRRHFQMIAAVLRAATLEREARSDLAARFADACERENPRFDRERFLAAVEADERSGRQ